MAPTAKNNPATATSAKKKKAFLTELTEKFVKLVNSSPERVIDINEAEKRLHVRKRRIYDVTNVLEGVGLLHKMAKNLTRWIDCPRDSEFAARPTEDTVIPDAELISLYKTYKSLEDGITDLEAQIRQTLSVEGAYVTYHDVKSFFNDQIVIAVKAPPETRLEVNENLQIWMKSETNEAIEVYLCPQYAPSSTSNSDNNMTQQQLQQQNGYQMNTSPHLQQSQLSNSSNAQPLDATITNTNNFIEQQQPQTYMPVSSDEGRGRSSATTDGQYPDYTSGVSNEENYYTNDPTLSSALSGTISEDEDPFKPLVPFEAREETHYNFMLDDNYTITSLFPEDNLGLI